MKFEDIKTADYYYCEDTNRYVGDFNNTFYHIVDGKLEDQHLYYSRAFIGSIFLDRVSKEEFERHLPNGYVFV